MLLTLRVFKLRHSLGHCICHHSLLQDHVDIDCSIERHKHHLRSVLEGYTSTLYEGASW
jgi:hypothetical protein